MNGERIVAVGLLTQAHLDMLGPSLKKVYPVDDTPSFSDLLRALDKADREHWRKEDRLQALRRLQEETADA